MIYVFIFLAFTISVVLSGIIIPKILVVSYTKNLFDAVDERKVHTGLVPRLGGLSFIPVIFMTLALVMGARYLLGYEILPNLIKYVVPEFSFLICGLSLLYIIGVKDDLVGARYRTKFAVQFVAASFLPLSGLWINNLYGIFGVYELSPWVGIPLTILLIVFLVNAINLIDGIDGLASGLSMAALIILGSLFIVNSMWIYAMLAFATLEVLFTFFYYNVYGKAEKHNKIFMGDTGSLTLGYILTFLALSYAINRPGLTPDNGSILIVSFSTLIVPMLDVLRVIVVRLMQGKSPFEPDRNHIHHKFLEKGLTARQSMMAIIAIACGFSFLNIFWATYSVNANLIIVMDIIMWSGLSFWLSRKSKATRIPTLRRTQHAIEIVGRSRGRSERRA